jgi:putative DNA primase/helicase
MRDVKAAELKKLDAQRDAARNAAGILKQCAFGKHDYLKAKGFDEEEGNIFIRDGVHLLAIPMRVGGSLVGCQLIDPEGGKKFLYGQRTSGATFTFDNKGPHYLCEGYATALSVRHVLKNLKKRYTLHVCFSAYNMKRVAESLKPDSGYLIADNDASGTGERVAKEIGWPYWMSDTIGEDANDAHKRMGLFKFSQSLIRSLHRV